MSKNNLLFESKDMFSVHMNVVFDHGKRTEYFRKIKGAHIQDRFYSSPNVWIFSSKIPLTLVTSTLGVFSLSEFCSI